MPINFLYQAEYKNNNAIELYYIDFIVCPLAVWNIVCKERINGTEVGSYILLIHLRKLNIYLSYRLHGLQRN